MLLISQSTKGKAIPADQVLRGGVWRRAAGWAPRSAADFAGVQTKTDGQQCSLRVPRFDRVSFPSLVFHMLSGWVPEF